MNLLKLNVLYFKGKSCNTGDFSLEFSILFVWVMVAGKNLIVWVVVAEENFYAPVIEDRGGGA